MPATVGRRGRARHGFPPNHRCAPPNRRRMAPSGNGRDAAVPEAGDARSFSPPSGMLKHAAIIVGGWTAYAFLWAANVAAEGERSFANALETMLPFYWGWALITPPILWWADRAIRRFGAGPRVWTAVAMAAPAVVVLHGAAYLLLLEVLGLRRPMPVWDAMVRYVPRHAGGDLATYAALIGLWLLLDAQRRARQRDVDAAQLHARLARADLELLRWQLQPHFLFNALNTVSTLVLRSEPQRANEAIDLVARYLRAALRRRPDALVGIEDELADVRRYLAIEALRFGGDLRLETQIPGNTLGLRLPAAILQPLVENAIRHGRAASDGAGPIVIATEREGDRVRLTVADPGPGGAPARDEPPGDGFGIAYVRERLRHVYGDAARFELRVSPAGTVAVLELPLEVTS
jgi:two-component system, LytTR family, sensor kinase